MRRSPQLPAAGFKALLGDDGHYCNFTLASLPRSLGCWPRAHTCFNRIDLPLFDCQRDLADAFAVALDPRHAEAFSMD